MNNNIERPRGENEVIKQHIASIKSNIDLLAEKYAERYLDQEGFIGALAENAKTEADKLLNKSEIAQNGESLPIFLIAINFLSSSDDKEKALKSAIEKLYDLIQEK